jgi:hypothetical protein
MVFNQIHIVKWKCNTFFGGVCCNTKSQMSGVLKLMFRQLICGIVQQHFINNPARRIDQFETTNSISKLTALVSFWAGLMIKLF